MKKFFFNVFVTFVKLFPSRAMRFTKKSNPNSFKFMLPHDKELKVIEKMSTEEVKLRNWSSETKIYCVSNALWELFVEEIINSTEFEALCNNPTIEKKEKQIAIRQTIFRKNYTLSDEQARLVCIEFDCIADLYAYQLQKITLDLVKKLSPSALNELLKAESYLKKSEKLPKNVISFFLRNFATEKHRTEFETNYNFSQEMLYRKMIVHLIESKYCFTKEEISVLARYDEELLSMWMNEMPRQDIFNVCVKCGQKVIQKYWDMCDKSQQYDLLAKLLPDFFGYLTTEIYQEKIEYLLSRNQALPKYLPYLRIQKRADLFQLNFDLCHSQKLLGQMDKSEVIHLNKQNFEKYVLAMAKEKTLSHSELASIKDCELKIEVNKILIENSQIDWLKEELELPAKRGWKRQEISPEEEETLKFTKLCDEAQLLLFYNGRWLKTYYTHHRICLKALWRMMTDSSSTLKNYIKVQGLTCEEYDMLLTSASKSIAPWAAAYIR